MRLTFYRALLVLCALGAALVLPTLVLSIRKDLSLRNGLPRFDVAAFIGFGMLPVAVVGLWNWRRSGFVTLMVGTFVVALTTVFHLGFASALKWTTLHFICLCSTLFRYVRLRRSSLQESAIPETCIHCDGSGVCSICRGAGELPPIVAATDSRRPFMVPCGACSGTGKCLACQADLREITLAEATNWRLARNYSLSPMRFPAKRRMASLLGFNATGSFFSLQRMFLSLTMVGIGSGFSWYLARPEIVDSSMYLVLLGWGSFLGIGVGILWRRPLLGGLVGLALTWVALRIRN